MTTAAPCIKDCYTCRSMATHEDCNKDGQDCLSTPEDWAQYRTTGKMPPNRYRHWIESTPMEQMERLHALQLSGARQIVLGPGEAEVNTRQSPEEASKHLHHVADECGYMVGRLTPDRGDGKQSLTVCKDFGPFRIEWEGGRLARIIQGDKKEGVFWDALKAW